MKDKNELDFDEQDEELLKSLLRLINDYEYSTKKNKSVLKRDIVAKVLSEKYYEDK